MTRRVWIAVLCMALCSSAYALSEGEFRSVGDIVGAKTVLIVQAPTDCRPLRGLDGVMNYDVTLLKVLRGDVGEELDKEKKRRRVAISTTHPLRPGARYMLAGEDANRDGKPWLLFHYELGVIEIPSQFKLQTLEGEDIEAQVSLILSARRAEVEKQLRDLRREKELLDKSIPKDTPYKSLEGDGK